MKISLGSAIVIAVVVYTALCYRDEECGPDSGNFSVIAIYIGYM